MLAQMISQSDNARHKAARGVVELAGPDIVDERMMRLAVAEARKGVGLTRPNPPVGAVVADAAGRVIGRGHHCGAGLPHAEVNAVANCGDADLSGCTIYVTLEPCSTYGRTPPCTELILSRKIRRVVVGATDPNPKHAGRGLDILRAAGVEVVENVRARDCQELIAPFASAMLRGRPRTTLKLAMTLDGRIADRTGRSKWITSAASRTFVQRLRRGADAILVGSGTALADNPSLTCRLRGAARTPIRVVADSSGHTSPTLSVVSDASAQSTIIATTKSGAKQLSASLPKGASVWTIDTAADGRINLEALLRRLTAERDVMDLLCEGGGMLAGALLKAGLVDRLVLMYAPVILGDDNARPSFSGIGNLLSEGHLEPVSRTVRTFGGDTALIFDLRRSQP